MIGRWPECSPSARDRGSVVEPKSCSRWCGQLSECDVSATVANARHRASRVPSSALEDPGSMGSRGRRFGRLRVLEGLTRAFWATTRSPSVGEATGTGEPSRAYSRLLARRSFSCELRTDATLACWGPTRRDNSMRLLGGSSSPRPACSPKSLQAMRTPAQCETTASCSVGDPPCSERAPEPGEARSPRSRCTSAGRPKTTVFAARERSLNHCPARANRVLLDAARRGAPTWKRLRD